jgi:protein-S-isoprenylcysteine O-methyltransferase Ste14
MNNLIEKAIHFIAIFVIAFEMAVPVYWLSLHVPVAFWRRHARAAFPVAVLVAWGVVDLLLYRFHADLFRQESTPGLWLPGMALIGCDIFTLSKSEVALGGHRIVGQSELAGSRELVARGLYTRVRHPRYLGMIAGVFGACLIIASRPLWAASVVWLFLVLLSIRAEEHELRARLGPAYAAYAERVPGLLPFRLSSRGRQAPENRERRS